MKATDKPGGGKGGFICTRKNRLKRGKGGRGAVKRVRAQGLLSGGQWLRVAAARLGGEF